MNATARMAMPAPTGDLDHAVRDAGARCVDAFAGVVAGLHDLRGQLGTMCDDLDGLSRLAVDDDDVGKEGALPVLLDAMQALRASLAEKVGPSRAARYAAPAKAMGTVARMSVKLSSIDILIRASANAEDLRALEAFLTALRALTRDMQEAARTVSAMLDALRRAEDALMASAARVVAGLDGALPVIGAKAEEAGRLDAAATEAAQRLRAETTAVDDGIRAQMKRFVSAIQFSDRLAQRLDHVAVILDGGDARLFPLAAAQLRDLAGDLGAETGNLGDALHRIAGHGARGAGLFTSDAVTGGIERVIKVREETALRVSEALDLVESMIVRMEGETAAAREAIESSARQVVHLDDVSRDLDQAAINSALVAARAKGGAGPLRFLSGEVRSTAAQCFETLAEASDAIGALGHAVTGAIDCVQHGRATMTDAAGRFRADTAGSRARLGALDTLRGNAASGAERTVNAVAALHGQVRDLQALAGRLSQLAATLVDQADPAPPDAEILAGIRASYTMHEERVTHDALYPGAADDAPVSALPAASADDDIDDVFF